ncbi:MAG TPA: hypothetical protein VHQ45_02770 [Gemmatimonadaceae bacterium]|nr:hypothetical protein [Gemmatimonadaceae bacterium]
MSVRPPLRPSFVAVVVASLALIAPSRVSAQQPASPHPAHPAPAPDSAARAAEPPVTEPTPVKQPEIERHEMWMRPISGGWHVMGMAQLLPTVTSADPFQQTHVLRESEAYLTQPAVMFDVASPGSRVALRTTLNFEAWTQPDGELTYGGWGEGFLDRRHPHTLVHELMLSVNAWDVGGTALSLSAGKGFAPYGTDDPMARPVVKYPTNHHLSQILERWTVNAQLLAASGWSLEAGIFGGAEPVGPYDFDNLGSFGDSWSARAAWRGGEGYGPFAPWEVSSSYARVTEGHHGSDAVTQLANVSVRHSGTYGPGHLYGMVEASRSWPEEGDGYYSLLGETRLGLGREARHQPYYRVELATRPEYERQGVPGTQGFFRYDHDAHEIGATRWLINAIGYGYQASDFPMSVRPYVEAQHHVVWPERGDVDPRALYGTRNLWSVSAGVRVFFGGGPMRMGSYGVLDPMSAAMRPREGAGTSAPEHEGHERH